MAVRRGARPSVPVVALLLWLSVACAPACGAEPLSDLGPAEGESHPAKTDDSGGHAAPAPANEKPAFVGGRIEGTITPPARARKVYLVERDQGRKQPAQYDGQTGKFFAEGLPAGVWAVEIETTWGRAEGIDMRFRPADAKAPGATKDAPPSDQSTKSGAAQPAARTEEPKPSDKPDEPRPSAKP